MNHINILKRSWQILWRYRALWFFGIILAIASAPGSGGGSSGTGYTYGDDSMFHNPPQEITLNTEDWESFGDAVQAISDALTEVFDTRIPMIFGTSLMAIAIGLVCIAFILAIVFTVLKYIANTSAIRMVDEYEETEETKSIGKGFHLGWSRASWRIFLIDLVINIPFIVGAILLITLSGLPALLWITKSTLLGILGTITAVGFLFLAILLLIVIGAAVKVTRMYIYRVCALENLGVFGSIRTGYQMLRQNLKDSVLLWLITLGIGIGYRIVSVIASLIFLIPAAIIGGGLGLLSGGFGRIIDGGFLPWLMGGLVGIPVFMLIIGIPLLIMGGWKEVYFSSLWTLAYRDLKALDPMVVDVQEVPADPDLVDLQEEDPL